MTTLGQTYPNNTLDFSLFIPEWQEAPACRVKGAHTQEQDQWHICPTFHTPGRETCICWSDHPPVQWLAPVRI